MPQPRSCGHVALATLLAVFVCAVGTADAKKKSKPDPALTCVSAKHKAAGAYCAAVLGAWSKFEKSGDSTKRDAAIARAKERLEVGWRKAEDRSGTSGVNCEGEFLATSTAGAFVDSASG